jgi:hypothetical protein
MTDDARPSPAESSPAEATDVHATGETAPSRADAPSWRHRAALATFTWPGVAAAAALGIVVGVVGTAGAGALQDDDSRSNRSEMTGERSWDGRDQRGGRQQWQDGGKGGDAARDGGQRWGREPAPDGQTPSSPSTSQSPSPSASPESDEAVPGTGGGATGKPS